MIRANSRIRMNMGRIGQMTGAASEALEMTAESLHTEVEQAQVFPFHKGNLQNESTFADNSQSGQGRVPLVSSTPYARRLYYHPEYHFRTDENPNARGKWYEDWLPGGSKENFAPEAFKEFYRGITGI